MDISDLVNQGIVNFGRFTLDTFMTEKKNVETAIEKFENAFSQGPVIMAYFPHTSFFDSIVVLYPYDKIKHSFPPYIAKDKHVNNRLYGWLMKKNGTMINVDYTKTDMRTEVVEKSEQLLRQGENLILFPEGTRYHKNQPLVEKLSSLNETAPEYNEYLKSLNVGTSFVQMAFETGAQILPVRLIRTGILGLRFSYFVGEPRIFTTENSELRPKEGLKRLKDYFDQFKIPARKILLETYNLR